MSDRYQAIGAIDHRTRDYRKIALSFALLLAAAAALIGGAFATFTDTVTAGPQAITSGSIKIAVGPTNDVATGATNIAAGDTIAREADLNSTGRDDREQGNHAEVLGLADVVTRHRPDQRAAGQHPGVLGSVETSETRIAASRVRIHVHPWRHRRSKSAAPPRHRSARSRRQRSR